MPATPNAAPKPTRRKVFTSSEEILELPNLIELQTKSFNWFKTEGLQELFDEVFPIEDYGKNLSLNVKDFYWDEPKYTVEVAKDKNTTFEVPLKAVMELINLKTGEKKNQEVFLGDYPMMTAKGTFLVNGVERVVVSQLVRSPGVFFTSDGQLGLRVYGAKIIPSRGAWLEIETSAQGVMTVKIDRKRKLPVTTLLRAFGYGTNDQIRELFKEIDNNPDKKFIEQTLEKDSAGSTAEGLMEVYRRIRPGDLATVENSKQLIEEMFFTYKRYDFSAVGRYKLNQRLNIDVENNKDNRVLRKEDLVEIVKEVIRLNNTQDEPDDIDRLDNRRLKMVGELIQAKFRVGLLRMERNVKDRMTVYESESVVPSQLINVRPIVSSVKEFFASSQLSQFMDKVNPLSEIVHKRRLSAMGPGGLTRERAGFEVRDVHKTHYGRICPIETPEGPNIGLVNTLATYALINEYGFIETPYRIVINEVKNDGKSAVGHIARSTINDAKGTAAVKPGDKISEAKARALAKLDKETIPVKAKVTGKIEYMDASKEQKAVIAQANTPVKENGYFANETAAVRRNGEADEESSDNVTHMDISSKQTVSISTALIPFLEHDDAKRALMGANMQRQAVPLLKPQSPIVGTGVEGKVAVDSGQVILAPKDGKVISAESSQLVVKYEGAKENAVYDLVKYERSNQGSCINQRPTVTGGMTFKKGDLLADGMSTEQGELALGQNVVVAYMSWGGSNFEDAIIISQNLVKDDRYTSIHIEKHEIDVRDTKLGPEVITRDIPNVSDEALRDLDEDGIIRIGAEVSSGDILVGKITPKGETELTAEERLLRAIFGEKARDVKDTSLTLPNGEYGKIVGVKIYSRDQGDELPPGVIKQIHVSVAQMRKISIGDKMAGRHGNKGVIARILPVEDMPYLEDGTPVDIVLTPLGVTSRMNIGQILETHLGWAANALGYKIATPVFDGIKINQIKEELKKSGLPEAGKADLYDGRTGDRFSEKVTIGYNYMLKLTHLVDDKIHARSTGPYAMVTQQPLGGKAQMGGQRFGEMEVWALQAYGASHTLQEILTIKSDDVVGRSKAYESIIKDEPIKEPQIPESFNVLVKELQSLGLGVDLVLERPDGRDQEIDATEVIESVYDQDIEDLGEDKLMQGESAAEGEAVVDLGSKGEIDDFEVLAEADAEGKE